MPIGLPVATLIGSAIAGGTTAYGIKASGSANKRASEVESKYGDEALKDERAEREYQRQRDEEDRRLALSRDDREYGYRAGRDAISDARFNDERDYGRGQFASYKSRLAPFSDAGTRSVANLSSVIGRGLPASIPTAGTGGMVRLQSPTGQVSEVPAAHLDHYLSLGAKQV